MKIYDELFAPQGAGQYPELALVQAVCALADEVRATREMLKPLVDYALSETEAIKKEEQNG